MWHTPDDSSAHVSCMGFGEVFVWRLRLFAAILCAACISESSIVCINELTSEMSAVSCTCSWRPWAHQGPRDITSHGLYSCRNQSNLGLVSKCSEFD